VSRLCSSLHIADVARGRGGSVCSGGWCVSLLVLIVSLKVIPCGLISWGLGRFPWLGQVSLFLLSVVGARSFSVSFSLRLWVVMPSVISRPVSGVGSINSSIDGRSPRSTAYGFRLASFSHVFTPVIPLVSTYHQLRGEGRAVQTAVRDLCVEVFVRDRWNACLRVVCHESMSVIFLLLIFQ
jgi:hypothetical protein